MSALFERKTDLTVIVPVYNLEGYLEPLLTTLEMQDVNGYKVETIFVLNNCTDGSEQVIRDSVLDCKIVFCSEQGCGCARNKGLNIAQGEYIWMMDGDDWLLSDTAIRDVLDKAKACNLNILRIPYASEKFQYLYFSMVWQYLFRMDYIKEFRFPSYQPGEDDAFMLKVLEKAGHNPMNFYLLPSMDRPLYYYNYMREGSNMFRCRNGERI